MKNKIEPSKMETSMGDLADAAFKQVVEKVIKRAHDAGSTMIVSKDGQMIALSPAEARSEAKKNMKAREKQT